VRFTLSVDPHLIVSLPFYYNSLVSDTNVGHYSCVSEVTMLLAAVRNGDSSASDALLNRVYVELRDMAARKMASESPGHTLQATALVHEAWLRLGSGARFENRGHFFSAAAEAMRRILIDRARRRATPKHGGNLQRCDIDGVDIASPVPGDDHLLAVNDALDAFAIEDPEKAELVKLRFYTGLSLTEAASVLGISDRTAARHWAYAKAWLCDAMGGIS
jgi:RNA polymerase sigma factor (TIGR02999 family)